MSFPTGVQTVTVTAPANGYRTLDGDYQQGTITLTPTVPEVVSAEHGIIAVGAVQFTVGASGSFTPRAVLPNDAEGFTPEGWTYRLDQNLTGETPRSYNVLIPASAGSVDLSTLVEVEASTGIVVSVPGGHGTPSDTVTAETNYGLAASAGVSTDYARGDHTHGSPALPPTGTTAGTYAAGDDSRIVGAVQKAQNLADLASAATARANLGLARPWRFDITDPAYGAKGDAVIVTDGAVNVGVATLTCATSRPFTAGDVGKHVLVQGAGTFGVTAWATTIAGYNGPDSVALAGTPPTSITGAIVVFGTNNYDAIRAATAAAEAYRAVGHPYSEVYTPPTGGYVIDGPLDTSKSGNGQVVFGPDPTTAGKKTPAFVSDGSGAGVRHWEQTVPQISGATWISFGFYSSTSAQLTDLNANGNPGVISGPNEGASNGLAYGASARFSNTQPMLSNMAILTPHTAYGITWGGFNFYGCANAHVRNVSISTLGTVPSSTDYTSPGTFGTGLSVGCLMPAPGNNDLSIVDNLSIQGGYTYGIFFSEHTLISRIMVLYCWAALCAVGSYAGSVGSVHEMRVLSASVEACTHEVYIVGVGSQGVGPTVDIHLSTESSTPNVDGNGVGALMGALGTLKLTGLFTPSGVSIAHPTGIEIVNGQVPRAVSRKTAGFTASPIDRVLLCDTTAGGFTATLPDADVNPVEYTLKNTGSNLLTVASTGGQLIHPAGTTTMTVAAGNTVRFLADYDGTAWGWYAV
jgi:hypothetical protein